MNIYQRISEKDVSIIREMYVSGHTARQIHNLYSNICENTIIKIVKDGGIEIRKAKRFTKINESFFETIDSPEKAYILGLLITDGYVTYPNRDGRSPSWGITLQSQDLHILNDIKSALNTDKKICKRIHNNSEEYYLIITSQKMVDDLSKYGVVPRKSKTTRLPIISQKYMPDLIRGIFDGDGCVAKTGVCSFCGNEQMISDIKNFLVSNLGISNNKISNRHNSKINSEYMDVFAFYFSSKDDKIKFYNYIYYSDSVICLKRKKDKLESFIK